MSSGRQAGFTLIEVLVALAILSLAVVASIQGFAQGLRLLKLAGDHQQAMLLADQKVREVVEFKEGRDGGTEGLLRWERTLRSLETPDLATPGAIPAARVYAIDVRVTWDPQRHIEISTLRTVPTETTQTVLPGGAAPPSTASGRPGTASSGVPTPGSTPFLPGPSGGSSSSRSSPSLVPGAAGRTR